MKIAVITANFGNFDTVKEIPPQTVKFDRFYFTEENSPYPFHTIDNRLKAKYFKICPHLVPGLDGYDIFVWIDGNIQVKSEYLIEYVTKGLVDPVQGADFSISPHPTRKSIYEEASFIIKGIEKGNKYLTSRYSIESIFSEMNAIGPGKEGLYWCGLFARRNETDINEACDYWWERNILYTNFDQLNFVETVHDFNLNLAHFHFTDFYDNKYYKLIQHRY